MSLNSRTAMPADVSNYFLQTALWPAVVYTLVLMVTGIFGNSLVLLVYRRHFRRSVTRMFIFTLAALDLGSCLITMPSELLILFQFASFPSAGWCKASRYLTYTFNGSSSLILIVIAMDRYYKVCRPYNTCITISIAKKICVGGFLFTAILSIPSLLLYRDVNFPVLVRDGRAEILPLDVRNATWLPEGWNIEKGVVHSPDKDLAPHHAEGIEKFIFQDRSPVSISSSRGPRDTRYTPVLEGSDDRNLDIARRASQVGLVFGDFCLISSEDSGSPLAVMFYLYMFLLWLLLLILAIYFYSRVAHAMFLLRNIHDKMFSFSERGDGDGHKKSASRRSCTPRTASLAQENSRYEYDVQYHHQIGIQGSKDQLPAEGVVLLAHGVLEDNTRQNGGLFLQKDDLPSNADLQTNNEKSEASQKEMDCLDRLPVANTTGDCVHDTGTTSQNLSLDSVNSMDSANQQTTIPTETSTAKPQLQVSADSVYETGSLETSSCLNLPQGNKDIVEARPNSMGSPRSKSMDDVLQGNPEDNVRTAVKRKSFRLGRFSSKRKSGKVPKIKVSKEKSKSKDAISDGGGDRNLFLHPQSTNSLLQRRIRSMENVNSISKLDSLQVPNKRNHGPVIPKNAPARDGLKERGSLRKPRETAAGIGTLTNSSTSLQYSTSAAGSEDACDAKQATEKTLTLTRSSGRGKKNVCVLPLTGLTTKAAIQNQESEEKKQMLAQAQAATLPAELTYASVLAATQSGRFADRRGSGMDTLENPPFEHSVSMRSRSKFSRSSVRKTAEIEEEQGESARSPLKDKNPGQNGPGENNVRRARPSTADILSERHRRGTLHPVRTSRMLFIISMAFLVSFLPFFVIVLMRSAIGSSSFLASLSETELGVVSIFIRSTLLSNAVNPVIYGLLSTHFRRECTGLFQCIVGNRG